MENNFPAVTLAFEGDASTYASGRKNLRTHLGNAYKRKETETNDAFQNHLYHRVHQTIQRRKMVFTNDARVPFTHSTDSRAFRDLFCLICSLRHVETESRFVRTHDFAYSSILRKLTRPLLSFKVASFRPMHNCWLVDFQPQLLTTLHPIYAHSFI